MSGGAQITLQLGQCGNQVGKQLLQGAYGAASTYEQSLSRKDNENYFYHTTETFFYQKEEWEAGQSKANARGTQNNKLVANAVMIDTEEKVVRPNLQRNGTGWCYDPDLVFCGQKGAGNNWAYGYSHYGNEVCEQILDKLRKLAEKLDRRLSSFLVSMSLAGGTGSGLGSKVSEAVRDMYPRLFILSQVVWPFKHGEIILQDYNTLLSLSTLCSVSDGVLIHRNDVLQKICEKRSCFDLGASASGVSQPSSGSSSSFADINQVIAAQILGSILPCIYKHKCSNNIPEILTRICCPPYKLLNAYHVPQFAKNLVEYTTLKWDSLNKDLKQMYLTDSYIDECLDWSVNLSNTRMRSMANHIVARGSKKESIESIQFLQDTQMHPKWFRMSSGSLAFSTTGDGIFSEKPLLPYDKSMFLLSNNQSNVPLIDNLLSKCWKMYSAKAYLHQYSQHGVEENDFLNCFVNLEGILKTYKKLD